MAGEDGRPEAVPADEADEDAWARRIEIVVRSLQAALDKTVEPARIRAEVEAQFAAYAQARVRDFVPVLVESRVRSSIRAHP